jgi:hypothetical protein
MERRSCFDRVDVTVKDPSAAIRVQHDSPTLSRWIPSILAIAILVRTLCTCLIVRNMTNGATDPANCSDDTAASTFDAALPPVEASSSSTSASPPVLAVVVPQVLDRCSVRWRNGELLRAEIIEIRPSRSYLSKMNRKRKCDESSSSSAAMAAAAAVDPSLLTNPDDIDYYVHYVGHDRRLDEWIAYGAIQPGSLQRGGALSTASAVAGGGGGLAEQQPHDLNLLQQHSGLPMRRRSSGALNTASSFDAGGSGGVSSGGGSFHGSDDGVINSGGGGNWHAPDPSYEREHEETTKVKNVERIIMGRHAVQCWYYSQFPEAYHNLPVLYVCEFCLSYMKKLRTYRSHMCTCPVRHPPGRRIYQEGDLSVYEIDGKDNKAFCQKLCLIAKLFLDHKTLYYDVNPFLFYVVCLDDIKGSRMVGYFSKEKVSDQGYNLACILTLPQYQTRGYGKFIIRCVRDGRSDKASYNLQEEPNPPSSTKISHNPFYFLACRTN